MYKVNVSVMLTDMRDEYNKRQTNRQTAWEYFRHFMTIITAVQQYPG